MSLLAGEKECLATAMELMNIVERDIQNIEENLVNMDGPEQSKVMKSIRQVGAGLNLLFACGELAKELSELGLMLRRLAPTEQPVPHDEFLDMWKEETIAHSMSSCKGMKVRIQTRLDELSEELSGPI
jgi:hypothetical protein